MAWTSRGIETCHRMSAIHTVSTRREGPSGRADRMHPSATLTEVAPRLPVHEPGRTAVGRTPLLGVRREHSAPQRALAPGRRRTWTYSASPPPFTAPQLCDTRIKLHERAIRPHRAKSRRPHRLCVLVTVGEPRTGRRARAVSAREGGTCGSITGGAQRTKHVSNPGNSSSSDVAFSLARVPPQRDDPALRRSAWVGSFGRSRLVRRTPVGAGAVCGEQECWCWWRCRSAGR